MRYSTDTRLLFGCTRRFVSALQSADASFPASRIQRSIMKMINFFVNFDASSMKLRFRLYRVFMARPGRSCAILCKFLLCQCQFSRNIRQIGAVVRNPTLINGFIKRFQESTMRFLTHKSNFISESFICSYTKWSIKVRSRQTDWLSNHRISCIARRDDWWSMAFSKHKARLLHEAVIVSFAMILTWFASHIAQCNRSSVHRNNSMRSINRTYLYNKRISRKFSFAFRSEFPPGHQKRFSKPKTQSNAQDL